MRAQLGGDQPGALLRGQAAEQPGLAARPGAQVQPPVVAAGQAARVSAMAASWLASSWTPARPCGDGRDPGRVALGR